MTTPEQARQFYWDSEPDGSQTLYDWMADFANSLNRELTADRDKWRDRCERLVKALDIAGKRCQDVHHSAKHRHSDDEDCLAVKFIYEAQQLYRDAVCESVDQQIQKEIDDDTTR